MSSVSSSSLSFPMEAIAASLTRWCEAVECSSFSWAGTPAADTRTVLRARISFASQPLSHVQEDAAPLTRQPGRWRRGRHDNAGGAEAVRLGNISQGLTPATPPRPLQWINQTPRSVSSSGVFRELSTPHSSGNTPLCLASSISSFNCERLGSLVSPSLHPHVSTPHDAFAPFRPCTYELTERRSSGRLAHLELGSAQPYGYTFTRSLGRALCCNRSSLEARVVGWGTMPNNWLRRCLFRI